MNMQALMKQAQAMQKKMLDSKNEIEKMEFEGKSELVTVKMNGKREVLGVIIEDSITLEKDDIEILQDMIAIAVNDALKQIDKITNEKLGSQAGSLGSLF